MEQIEAYHSSNRHRNRVSWTVDQACRIFGKIPHRAVPCLQQEVKTSFVKAYFKFCKRSKSTKNAKHSFKPLKSNLWLREDLPLECKTFLLLLMEMTSSASLLKKSIHAERSVTIKRIVGVDCSILNLVCSPCIKIRYGFTSTLLQLVPRTSNCLFSRRGNVSFYLHNYCWISRFVFGCGHTTLRGCCKSHWRWCTIRSPCRKWEASLGNRRFSCSLKRSWFSTTWGMWTRCKYAIRWRSNQVPLPLSREDTLILPLVGHKKGSQMQLHPWWQQVLGRKNLKWGPLFVKNRACARRTWCCRCHPRSWTQNP